jgi:hypothetical protein
MGVALVVTGVASLLESFPDPKALNGVIFQHYQVNRSFDISVRSFQSGGLGAKNHRLTYDGGCSEWIARVRSRKVFFIREPQFI